MAEHNNNHILLHCLRGQLEKKKTIGVFSRLLDKSSIFILHVCTMTSIKHIYGNTHTSLQRNGLMNFVLLPYKYEPI